MDRFLYDSDLRHESVKPFQTNAPPFMSCENRKSEVFRCFQWV